MFQLPRSQEEWKEVSQQFGDKWNFYNCIGSIDGKHIAIEKPPHSGSYFYNYKHTYSVVLMAVVNANYEFMMVDVGANGRVSDGGVLKNTKFWELFSTNQLNVPQPVVLPNTYKKYPFVMVGDEAFQLTPNLIKPYNKAVLNDERRIYNYRLSRARRIVENAFGILASRFKIFQKSMSLHPKCVCKVVLACCHLHNFLSKRKTSPHYLQSGDVDIENTDTGLIELGTWRNEYGGDNELLALQGAIGNTSREAKQIRDDFCTYFNTCGAVSWQRKCLNK